MKPANPDGRYELLDGQSHLGVISDDRTIGLIAGYIDGRRGER